MPRPTSEDRLATVRLLLIDYYASGRRRHTYESIARRAGVSRSTVGRVALDVRKVWPSLADLVARLDRLEHRVTELERQGTQEDTKEPFQRTPDTPDQAACRRRFEARLRAEKGQAWMDQYAELLDYQWEYLKASKFV